MNTLLNSEMQLRLSTALHNTSRAWRQGLDSRLKDLGVSQAGWMTIAMVAKANEALSQKQLADLLGVEPPTIVAMVDRLLAGGLVLRAASPLDRRVKLILLTDAGKALYGRVKEVADEFRAAVLEGLDPAAIAAAVDLLETIEARIEDQL
jgi:MarR family transcriptional regulator for hemolysin